MSPSSPSVWRQLRPRASRAASNPAGPLARGPSAASRRATSTCRTWPDPPAPVAPAVISRGENGRVVVRATQLKEPLRIDGKLDEEAYRAVPSIGDFIQTVPNEGEPASERTEAWVMYDKNTIYVACRCWDSAPPQQWTANELRRDTRQLRQNDMFGVLFDTFRDRRNGFNFYTNPLGAQADNWITGEAIPNVDWNPVWFVRTGRFEGGWTVEMAIPLKSIRYQSGANQTWGIQIRRAIRRKNEWTFLTFVPASTGGSTGILRVSAGATLTGLDLPPATNNMEFKPYGISKVTTDKLKTPQIINDPAANGGFDAKYGITANLTADVTVNTDFAQVEVDEQQLNLTRFALVFPEKRDFFLEGRGTYDFGLSSSTGSSGATRVSNGAPRLFYTRRIGLNSGRAIPVRVGGRVTGKVGKTSIGVMNIETGYESPTSIGADRCAPPYGTCTPATGDVAMSRVTTLRHRSWTSIPTHSVDSGAGSALETGDVLFLPDLRFEVSPTELPLFSPAIASSVKNVSFTAGTERGARRADRGRKITTGSLVGGYSKSSPQGLGWGPGRIPAMSGSSSPAGRGATARCAFVLARRSSFSFRFS